MASSKPAKAIRDIEVIESPALQPGNEGDGRDSLVAVGVLERRAKPVRWPVAVPPGPRIEVDVVKLKVLPAGSARISAVVTPGVGSNAPPVLVYSASALVNALFVELKSSLLDWGLSTPSDPMPSSFSTSTKAGVARSGYRW